MCSGCSILFGIIITIHRLFHKQAEPWEAAEGVTQPAAAATENTNNTSKHNTQTRPQQRSDPRFRARLRFLEIMRSRVETQHPQVLLDPETRDIYQNSQIFCNKPGSAQPDFSYPPCIGAVCAVYCCFCHKNFHQIHKEHSDITLWQKAFNYSLKIWILTRLIWCISKQHVLQWFPAGVDEFYVLIH